MESLSGQDMPTAKTRPFYIINAFTDSDKPGGLFNGNPAAVILETPEQSQNLSDTQRQALARELNLSETSFVTRTSDPLRFLLRWFTPMVEVDLCGHATLAAAEALLQAGWASRGDNISFQTRKKGILEVKTNADDSRLEMHFPLLDHRFPVESDERLKIMEVLGIDDASVNDMYRSEYDLVVLLRDEEMVRTLKPDFKRLVAVDTRGFIVASRGTEEGFVSRFFAPKVGIDEDPVTGSAHCVLAAVFVKEGETIKARQISQRGGVLWVGKRGRVVELSGECLVFVNGKVTV